MHFKDMSTYGFETNRNHYNTSYNLEANSNNDTNFDITSSFALSHQVGKTTFFSSLNID